MIGFILGCVTGYVVRRHQAALLDFTKAAIAKVKGPQPPN